ncbi:Hypothetical predicted protein [Prunus dulcis]|uniref:Uncharacterized protein n=1 Tax=Prunus dulcis TaxID=3755 RepID=A0A5E4FIH8_PRUDU|nr:hypothetical protein L3X38_012919 [Prunus dulcis]VVA27954.1 Hypothetical predicted protein [Prunus dulcis]
MSNLTTTARWLQPTWHDPGGFLPHSQGSRGRPQQAVRVRAHALRPVLQPRPTMRRIGKGPARAGDHVWAKAQPTQPARAPYQSACAAGADKEEAWRGCSIINLYELVQHAGNILPSENSSAPLLLLLSASSSLKWKRRSSSSSSKWLFLQQEEGILLLIFK